MILAGHSSGVVKVLKNGSRGRFRRSVRPPKFRGVAKPRPTATCCTAEVCDIFLLLHKNSSEHERILLTNFSSGTWGRMFQCREKVGNFAFKQISLFCAHTWLCPAAQSRWFVPLPTTLAADREASVTGSLHSADGSLHMTTRSHSTSLTSECNTRSGH